MSLAHFFLNLADTTLEYGNGGIAFVQRYIITVPMKIISAGMDCNVLEECQCELPKARKQARTYRRDRFVVGNLKDDPQVTISDALKPLCPTEVLEGEPPRRANVEIILKRLSTSR